MTGDWARCRHWIEAAAKRSPFETIEDVEKQIAEGKYLFFPGDRCAVVCEIQQYERRKGIVVMHGGGNLKELLNRMEPHLCKFAKAAGCDFIAGVGREGWKRAAKKNGYRFGFVFMMKDLSK